MTVAVGIASDLGLALLVAQRTVGEPVDQQSWTGCLSLLFGMALLSIVSFLILKVRSFVRRSGKEKPADFTSLRSTGKTIVDPAKDDDEDSDPLGGVN
jgi:hypothetical protein